MFVRALLFCTLVMTLVIALVACDRGTVWKSKSSAAEAAINDLVVNLVAADNRGDLDAVDALYADDIVLIPPYEPPVVGIEAVRDRYSQMFEAMKLDLGATIEETVVNGSWAYSRGTTRGRATPVDSENWHSVNDRYLMVLRRDGGRWQIVRLIWNAEQ